jgi:hypothetical protein
MRDAVLRRQARVLSACALALALGAGNAQAADPLVSASEIAEHVRELEAAILQARERLLLLVSVPRAPGAMPLHDEPELAELARELPALERELERWARFETGPAEQAER